MTPFEMSNLSTSSGTLGRPNANGTTPGSGGAGRSVRIMPFDGRHLEGVYLLYNEVFGDAWSQSFQARWQWANGQCPHPHSSPKWVLVNGERVVGFLATTPLLYRIKGNTVMAHTPCDYMVHPDYRFHGIKLMQEFFRSCDNCVTCDDIPATLKVTEWLGARRLGTLVRYVKLLDVRALRGRNALLGVPLLWRPMNLALRYAERSPSPGVRSVALVKPVEGFDERFERFFRQLARLAPAVPVRDLRFLEWRYGATSPHARREIGVLTSQDGELTGYVIFYQSTKREHGGYILDLQTLPPHADEAAAALLAYAVERLRANGAWSVRYHHYHSPYSLPARVLRNHGFIPRGGHRFLVRFKDSKWADIAQEWQNWNYSYGDSEASYSSV